MTAPPTAVGGPPPALPSRSSAPRASRLGGIRAVAGLEVRQRLRAGRWQLLLVIWFLLLLGLTALVRANLDVVDPFSGTPRNRGPAMFGVLMLVVLGLALLIVPSLTSASINGDRTRGVLATLQVTRLSAVEIALGKFVAAWGAALIFLAATLPLVIWCMAEGGTPPSRVLVVLFVVALLLGVTAALGLALSALLVRTTTSAVFAYLTVFALTVGTLLAFGLAAIATSEERQQTEQVPDFDNSGRPTETSHAETYTESVVRTDRVWWLLAPNPFVVLADAAPVAPRPRVPPGVDFDDVGEQLDPLGEISVSVRQLRLPPDDDSSSASYAEVEQRGPLVWPVGLAVDVAIGAAALYVTVRRLRTPSRKLPRGQRVA